MREGFSVPDFGAPVDIEAVHARVPETATVKGLMLQAVLDHVRDAGAPAPQGRGPYTAFRDYSGHEFVDVLLDGARALRPDGTLREGLRELGRVAYPALAESWIGKVVFSVLARDVGQVWKLVSKVYSITGNHGGGELLVLEDREAVLRVHGIYSFLDAYHFGGVEGVLQACRASGEVGFRSETDTAGQFWVRWD